MVERFESDGCVLFTGHVMDALAVIEDKSVQMIATSPPYYGLRDYGVKGQIGLESTPQEYVQRIVEIMRECRRVLRDDGIMWFNIGDSFAGSGKGRRANGTHQGGGKQGTNRGTIEGSLTKTSAPGYKNKDLIGIPWMCAFALRDDGWYLRSDVIWAKGVSCNPVYSGSSMPESVKDRPSKSHEYVFLLTKNSRYFFDQEAIKEPAIYAGDNRGARTDSRRNVPLANSINGKTGATRNIRSVWTINPHPYKEAHFATFPPKLAEMMVKSGSAVGDTVLDPFNGSGTTGKVALDLGRKYIGIDLNPDYIEMTKRRLKIFA